MEDMAKYLVRRPTREVGDQGIGKMRGRQTPTMTYMSNKLVPGCNTYIEFGWIYEVPNPNVHILEHVHNYDEIVIHFGSDPHNPEDLGAEIEFGVGGQPITFNTTSAFYLPKGLKHGPLIWKNVTRPHVQMTIIMGTGNYQEANPGRSGGSKI